MRNIIASVKNIKLLAAAGKTLLDRAPGVPGVGVLWGPTGFGKTTAAAWFAGSVDAVYVRACATWTPHGFLSTLMRELDAEPLRHCQPMLEHAATALAGTGRPLIVDEADHAIRSKILIETLRDVHDLTDVPLILIGMAEFRRKLVHREQLAGRVMQWVEFRAASLDDARTLAAAVCEVEVAEDLLERLHKETGGSMRGLKAGLARIENFARRNGKQRVTEKDWGRRELVFSSQGNLPLDPVQ